MAAVDAPPPWTPPEQVTVGDCREVLASWPAASVDAVVCDPPYGLGQVDPVAMLVDWLAGMDHRHRGFMGQAWDYLPQPETWRAVLRVLKPGGHLVAFGGTRTADLLGVALRLAGAEVRDTVCWLQGQGFPKSLDVSKAIDRAAGAEREVVGPGRWNHVKGERGKDGGITPDGYVSHGGVRTDETAPATPEAAAWQGWGTALKPAYEPILLARKPLAEATVAAQVLATGTGALNIDGCRIGTERRYNPPGGGDGTNPVPVAPVNVNGHTGTVAEGRWPANVALDAEAAAQLDAAVGEAGGGYGVRGAQASAGKEQGLFGVRATGEVVGYGDSGGPSRFFYTAKASTAERGEGNSHPTVKPLALMRWLVRLVCPPGGLVLDPFAGSGTTLLAAEAEGFLAAGIERRYGHAARARRRLAGARKEAARA